MRIADLPTPCALVELDVLERNARRMAERTATLGVRLRPHVKTHKCVEAARRQVAGGFAGVTVSTLAEARGFARAGFRDLTWAFPLPVDRIPEADDLARDVDRLNLLLDHEATLAALEAFARPRARRFPVFLEVDCGDHRSGVDPASDGALTLARRLHESPAVDFRGLLTHGGHAYHARDRAGVEEAARQERDVTVGFAERLRQAGIPVAEVSIGSTPTLQVADHLDGVTEVRPGNYALFDVFQATLGMCTLDDLALSVLATVVSVHPERGEVIVDAGALALGKDPGPVHLDPACGYGRVTTADAGTHLEGLRVAALSQEHGRIRARDGAALAGIGIGTRLRILPNHSCLTAAQHERILALRDGMVVEVWHPLRGW